MDLLDSVDSDDELKLAFTNKTSEEMNWMCGLCYKWYPEEDDLRSHVKNDHINKARFQKCQFCDKKFLTRFLCLRHEKTHKYDMKRPLCHYLPIKGKPLDYQVSNHFINGVKRSKLSDDFQNYVQQLTNRIENQKYECLECDKVFVDEELLLSHFEINHALQQCIFCQEYFENFNLLRDHLKDCHDYQFQTRHSEGAWAAWQQEKIEALDYNKYLLGNLAFFHPYAKSPNEEPVERKIFQKHPRKAILPSTTSTSPTCPIATYSRRNSVKLPQGFIANEIAKTDKEVNMIRKGIVNKPVVAYVKHPVGNSSVRSTVPSLNQMIRKPLKNDGASGLKLSKAVNQSDSVADTSANKILSPIKEGLEAEPPNQTPEDSNSPMENGPPLSEATPSIESSFDMENLEVSPPGTPYYQAQSPIDEGEYHSDVSHSSNFSDTPPKLDPMTPIVVYDDEAMDPEEEHVVGGISYDDDGGMLFIDETMGSELRCPVCKKMLEDLAALEKHVQRVHSLEKSERPYPCQFCGQGFSTQSNRKEHERIHTGERPYVCPYCQKGFTQISNLKKHISTHKDQNLRCNKCGKQFVKESSLLLHQRAHAADRRFRCHICDRAYNYASLLKRHMRIHTGELPYECDMCGMLFHELVSLHYHRKKIHTGERPHKCETCGRAFILSSDLKKHQIVHFKEDGAEIPETPPEVLLARSRRLVRRSKMTGIQSLNLKKRSKFHGRMLLNRSDLN